eukprot:EG_transcript_17456
MSFPESENSIFCDVQNENARENFGFVPEKKGQKRPKSCLRRGFPTFKKKPALTQAEMRQIGLLMPKRIEPPSSQSDNFPEGDNFTRVCSGLSCHHASMLQKTKVVVYKSCHNKEIGDLQDGPIAAKKTTTKHCPSVT